MANPFESPGGFDDIRPPPPTAKQYSYQQQSAQYDTTTGVRRSPPEWVPDANAMSCMSPVCGVSFDTLERRHHCRYCGQIYCSNCSSKYVLMPPSWEGMVQYPTRDPQRVCEACAAQLDRHQRAWSEANANANRENEISLDDYSTRYMNSPLRFTLGGEVRKAAYALRNLTDGVNFWEGDAEYFDRQLAGAEGIMFLTVGKIAFIGGVRLGTGLVVSRLPDGSWSAPCAVGSFGLTFGAVVGAEVTDFITPLDKKAIDEFCDEQTSKLSMGGEASLALGPLGRTAGGEAIVASDSSATSTTSYAQSRGFYGGITLDAAYVKVRDDVNLKFYGRNVSAPDLLRGMERQPTAATPLYEQLHAFYALLDQRKNAATKQWDANRPAHRQPTPYQQERAYTSEQSYQPPQQQMPVPQYTQVPPQPPQYAQFSNAAPPQPAPGQGAVGDSLFGNKQVLYNPFGSAQPTPGGGTGANSARSFPGGAGNDVVEV
mmetsp:Transcript_5602/g.7931  ORF Transcript_5602/g.7931 Transcript_5602/m.7931 type:complete len:486 (-) Transcript_5602:1891-3348(-)